MIHLEAQWHGSYHLSADWKIQSVQLDLADCEYNITLPVNGTATEAATQTLPFTLKYKTSPNSFIKKPIVCQTLTCSPQQLQTCAVRAAIFQEYEEQKVALIRNCVHYSYQTSKRHSSLAVALAELPAIDDQASYALTLTNCSGTISATITRVAAVQPSQG